MRWMRSVLVRAERSTWSSVRSSRAWASVLSAAETWAADHGLTFVAVSGG